MKFSVLIPAYKKTFILKAIESVLKQTFTDFELIIVNDHSPEDIKSIVELFTDNRIKYYENEFNCGALNVVDNWNICLSYAQGDYVVLMGDDDEMECNYLEEFSKLIEKMPRCNVYHCRTIQIDENSNIIGITQSWPEWESVLDNIWHRIRGYRNQYISDFVYKRDILVKNGGFYKLPLAWGSDDITAYIASVDCGIAHTQNPVFRYRINPQTISNSGNVSLKLEAINKEIDWLRTFIKEFNTDNELDNIKKNMISKYMRIYFRKKKIETIAYQGISYNSNYLKDMFAHLVNMNVYKMSIMDIMYAFVLYFKSRKLK